MKKSIAMRWVKALRGESEDGVYRQGIGMLVDKKDRFCCLGVLCNLHNGFDWKEDDFFRTYNYDGEWTSLPESVMTWSGMQTCAADLKTPLKYKNIVYISLMDANDEGVPFSKIADHIEKHYKEL